MVLGVGFEYLIVVSTGLVMASLLVYKVYAGI
jgi:hypothetical protein